MHFGATILYVPDVAAALGFWERAFDLRRRSLSEDGRYGELDTGDTALGFAAYALAKLHLTNGVRPHAPNGTPAPVQIAFITDDVAAVYGRAVAAGAIVVSPPEQQPWGQTVAWLRDPSGVLIEIGTPAK